MIDYAHVYARLETVMLITGLDTLENSDEVCRERETDVDSGVQGK